MTEKVKQSAAATGSDEIDIGRLVGTVIEARWWVLGTTAIFALCAVIYTFFATPIYSADALVQIEQNAGNSLVQDINSALANKPPASDAEIQLIRSRLPLYPKSPYSRRLFYKRNIIGNQVFTWAWRFKACLFDTELKAAQDYDIFLRMVVEYGEPWKVEEATQILHINHGEMQITSSPKKFSGYFHFYRKHKDKFDRASKKYQLFTLYQIRNKRMTWRTLLTLLSVRNSKRLAAGLRGR